MAMKMIWLALILLVAVPVSAQSDALLLYTVWEDAVQTVYVLNVDTGEQTLITELDAGSFIGTEDVGWSSDGRYVWVVDDPNDNRRRLRVYALENGLSERIIIENLSYAGCDASIEWSPDGQILSYFTGEAPEHQLTLLNVSDDVAYTFDNNVGEASAWSLDWSPDGRYLVRDIQPTAQQGDTMLVDTLDGSAVMTFNGANSEQFSPDGRLMAYANWNPARTVWLYDIVADALMEIGPGDLDRWSPDGRYLLLTRRDEQDSVTHFYYELATGDLTTIDTDERIVYIATWMQGASELLIVTSPGEDDASGQTLLRYAMASGEITPVIETPGSVGNVVPGGSWVAVTYRLTYERGYIPSDHIRITDGETTLDVELTIYDSYDKNAVEVQWSPDGRWLTLLTGDGIFRFDPEAATLERLPVDAYRFSMPIWSADSRYLLFRMYADQDDSQGEVRVWNTENETFEEIPYPMATIIGWQYGTWQKSLIYCGEG
jgi:Tol biopolymer transport system component